MNKVNKEDFQDVKIFGEDRPGMQATVVALKDTANDGESVVIYGIENGEVIDFPDEENLLIKKLPIAAGRKAMNTLINCVRTFEGVTTKSWFSVGTLGSKDINRNIIQPLFKNCSNNKERIEAVLGKSIRGNGTVEVESQAFNRQTGQPLYEVGEDLVQRPVKRTRSVVLIQYAE